MADPISPHGEQDHEPHRALAHDLRHSLFVLRTGIQLLSQTRSDEARFDEVRELLEREVQTAADRLNELLDLVAK